jgi:hypothetical protein
VKTEEWFQEGSSEQDSEAIRSPLGSLVEKVAGLARRGRTDRSQKPVATVPDPRHPDEPVNSL